MAYTNADFLIRTVMSTTSGLPEDVIVNDFAVHLPALSPDASEVEAAMDAVGDFFRGTNLSADTVGTYISDDVSRAATHTIQAYQIVAGPLGSPFLEKDWLGPTTEAGSESMPREVCGVLSFHADLTGISEEVGATRPKARRRGRIFVGPLGKNAISVSDNPPVLAPAFTNAMRLHAVQLFDDLLAVGWDWCVWSRADQTLRKVVAGWTDNAPDVQRRRGQAPTLRTVYTTV
jgi:hypothetical protein